MNLDEHVTALKNAPESGIEKSLASLGDALIEAGGELRVELEAERRDTETHHLLRVFPRLRTAAGTGVDGGYGLYVARRKASAGRAGDGPRSAELTEYVWGALGAEVPRGFDDMSSDERDAIVKARWSVVRGVLGDAFGGEPDRILCGLTVLHRGERDLEPGEQETIALKDALVWLQELAARRILLERGREPLGVLLKWKVEERGNSVAERRARVADRGLAWWETNGGSDSGAANIRREVEAGSSLAISSMRMVAPGFHGWLTPYLAKQVLPSAMNLGSGPQVDVPPQRCRCFSRRSSNSTLGGDLTSCS